MYKFSNLRRVRGEELAKGSTNRERTRINEEAFGGCRRIFQHCTSFFSQLTLTKKVIDDC